MIYHHGVTNYLASAAVSIRVGHEKEMASIWEDETNYVTC